MLIVDVPKSDMSALTHVLQLLPGENAVSYAGRVMSMIPELDSHLKRPGRISSLILPSQKSYTPLCKVHKLLNVTIIHALFNLVALEAGVRLNCLVANNHQLAEVERARVHSLRELHSLWLEPEAYQKIFLEVPDQKWKYQADECEACMLSRIGSNMTVLLNLRMALLSRKSSEKVRRYGPPRLMPWIERWLASLSTGMNLSAEDFEELISVNDRDGDQLKLIRKQLWHERHESRLAAQANRQKQKDLSAQVTDEGVIYPAPAEHIPHVATTATKKSYQNYFQDASDSSSDKDDVKDAHSALTSTPYLPATASTVASHEQRPTYFPQSSLPTHDNADTRQEPLEAVRPALANFAAMESQADRKQLRRSGAQRKRPFPPSVRREAPSQRDSRSVYNFSRPISPRDSYMPPPFPVHSAYIPPTAAAQAKLYQNLLSPNPLLCESEEELTISGASGIPKGTRERTSPPSWIPELADTSVVATPAAAPRPTATSICDEADWESVRASGVSFAGASTTLLNTMSQVSTTDIGSDNHKHRPEILHGINGTRRKPLPEIPYTDSTANLVPVPLRSRSTRQHPRTSTSTSRDEDRVMSTFTIKEEESAVADRYAKRNNETCIIRNKDRVMSTFTISEEPVEEDWYAQNHGSASSMHRSKTTAGRSGLNKHMSSASSAYSESRMDSSKRRTDSGVTDATRWSDLYKHLWDDVKGYGNLGSVLESDS